METPYLINPVGNFKMLIRLTNIVQNMLDHIHEIALLSSLEKYGSLAVASDSLGIGLTSASRMLARVEKELGFAVLDRSSRPARITAQAKLILPQVRKVMRAHSRLVQLVDHVRGGQEEMLIRVSLPLNSARDAMMVGIDAFKSRHVSTQVEVLADLGEVGLQDGLCDVAYFGYRPQSPNVFPVRLEPEVNMLFASRQYIKEHGAPSTVQDLLNHTVLTRYSSNPATVREITDGVRSYVLHADQTVKQGDAPYCYGEMVKGRGIALDLGFDYVEADLRRGDVVPVLLGWHRPVWDNYIVCHIRHQNNPAIRELMTLIAESHNRLVPSHWKHWYEYFKVLEGPVLEEMRRLRKAPTAP